MEKGCRCFDGLDNDGDGKIDASDSECATYYGLTYVGTSTNCSFPTPSGNIFASIGTPVVSGQNTSDTQSKVTVGDVDGDGIPDAVITSKWNSEIRIIATTSGQADGSSAGDVKSSFKTTGQGAKIFSGSGACDPKNLLYEHENLIADIDKDGKAEIFGVVSNRGGNPSTPPTCFFLVGFKYAKSTLVPLYNAVQIGTDRPGPIGIADMDGDGKAEIYLRDRIYAAETGVLLATGNGNWDLDIVSGSVAVDILKGDNGKMELVCGTKIYTIPSLTSRNPGSPAVMTATKDMNTTTTDKCFVKLMLDPVEYGDDTHSMCSVADVDRDGSIDVVISGALNDVHGNTAVFYWNVAKNVSTYYIPPDVGYSSGWPWGTGRVNLGDANGDGKTDLTFIAGNQLTCLTQNGSSNPAGIAGTLSLLWVRTINDSRSGVLGVTIYDFDNDGKPEVVYRDSQEVVIIDGATGATKKWSAICQSHTYTEGPVIADVNGDGATDICVTCNRSNSFSINDPIQQQALGEIRLFFTSGAAWLPTRKVWNQHGYFVVNIKDDLTLPFPQFDQSSTFSNGNCANGLVGPQKPMNVFMNQVPFLDASGCPVFPAPDLTFFGDDPGVGTDTNGDGVYTPAVVVTPPICGNLGISAYFNIQNSGDLAISDNVPVSFFNGDPTTNPAAVKLYNTTVTITNLLPGGKFVSPTVTFNGPGSAFDLYIVLYNNGSTLPIVLSGSSGKECQISNNMYKVHVAPTPFTPSIEKLSENNSCTAVPPYTGELRAHVYLSATAGTNETLDYSPYTFKWTNSANQVVSTAYNATGLVEDTYTLVVTNTQKGCSTLPISKAVIRTNTPPVLSINILSNQTKCSPADGKLQAVINGSTVTTGYTIKWYEEQNDIGITGPIASGLGNPNNPNYYFSATINGCVYPSNPVQITQPTYPDTQASETDVVDCINLNSGTVSGVALINGTAALDQSKYTFDWYYYDNVSGVKGSILPPANGTGASRSSLSAGYYQLIITDNTTLCKDLTPFNIQVKNSTVTPTLTLTPGTQTSCLPANPNGSIVAAGLLNGASAPLKYEWFLGDNTIAAFKTDNTSSTSTFSSGLGSGQIYTVKVSTVTNCSVTAKTTIPDNKVLPTVTLSATSNSICAPASSYNGKVTATVTNQVGSLTDYTFAFGPAGGTQGASPNHNVYAKLNGGITYTVIATYTSTGCSSVLTSIGVTNVQDLPDLTTGSTPSTNCIAGKEDGKATVLTVDGAAAPGANYTYAWTGPTAPSFPVNVATNTSNTFQLIKLQGGAGYDYTVLVTNTTNGCTNTAAVNVADAKVIPTITLAAVNNGIC
ncbi:MAG TPA: VCBS repeat-containing protein, partial [Cyclobacteriaceae bacterium]|nr:VCBS repeat-containing protein [Cyclobacteriaceae bacterium]